MSSLKLVRDSYSEMGTFGKLYINSQFFCYTVEKPWEENKEGESCIPEGTYPLGLRYSPVVKKTSAGEFEEGYEVMNVPGREYIMIHVGNSQRDFEGCIGLGDSLGYVHNEWAVLNSRTTFKKFMQIMEESNDWSLEITQYHP